MARPFPFAPTTVLIWFGIILISGLALWGTRPPRAVDASAPANVFSAVRAITHLTQIAKAPHPIGSDEAARVRDYLVEQLRGLGAEVQVEQGIGTAKSRRNLHSGLVNNIVARFPGQANSRALMLVAHYDSVPEGPGAADDGAGVAVILETLRALQAGPSLKNDLVILITDGEEAHGLLGALAYVAGHPDIANRIGVMVNLEARGTSGPGFMFETSNDNGALIREFSRAAPYPMATSLMAAVYKRLPNDTDFTPLKTAGLSGLNFAFIETYEDYHSRRDTVANLDPRSVQHVGANVLDLVRHLGNITLPLPAEHDVVYFNWFGSRLLVYPVWLAWALLLVASILFIFVCGRSASRFGFTIGRTAAGFGSFFLHLLVFFGSSFAVFSAAQFVAGEFLPGDTPSNQLLFAGAMGAGVGIALLTQRAFARKLGLANLVAGQLLAVALFSALICWFLAGGSYVLQWPLLFAMAGLFVGLRATDRAQPLFHFIFMVPALLILVPLAYIFFVALTFTTPALAAAAFLLAVLLALAAPLFDRLCGRRTVAVLLLFSATLVGAGIWLTKPSAIHPHRDSLVYSVNADEKKAKWISYDNAPDSWTGIALGSATQRHADPAYAAGFAGPILSSDATLVPVSPPSVSVEEQPSDTGLRSVRLQIASTRGARTLLVRLPAGLKLLFAGWNDNVQPIDDDAQWSFRFYNAPPEGVSLKLTFAGPKPIRIWVADSSPGFPAIPPLAPRPENTTPAAGSDITLVAASHEL